MSAPAPTVELPAAVDAYLTHLTVEKGRSALTIDAYRRDLRRYLAHLADRGVVLERAQEADVAGFGSRLVSEGLAPASVTRSLVSVRCLHRWLLAEGLTETDPTELVGSPRRRAALPKALAETEVLALIGSLEDQVAGSPTPIARRDLALLELLYSTGARVSEVSGLGFGDVDLDAALVRVFGKRSKERIVPLGRPAVAAFAAWLDEGRPSMTPERWRSRDDEDAVFLNARGGRLTRQGIWLVLRRRADAVGLGDRVSPHVLRHSCATHMLDHGADVRTVQELLGHASISTTQLYTKVATDRLWSAYRAAHPRAGLGS